MRGYGQFCPVALGAEVFAERWTPLILRELLAGSHRFSELQRGLPGITRPPDTAAGIPPASRAGRAAARPSRAGLRVPPQPGRPVLQSGGGGARPLGLPVGGRAATARQPGRWAADVVPAAPRPGRPAAGRTGDGPVRVPRRRQALLLARAAAARGRPVPGRPRLRHRPVRDHRRAHVHPGVPGPGEHRQCVRRRVGERGRTSPSSPAGAPAGMSTRARRSSPSRPAGSPCTAPRAAARVPSTPGRRSWSSAPTTSTSPATRPAA